jgi:flagellar hook-length control protein FliK
MPIISNSIQNNGGSSQGIRSQTRTYRSGNSTLHLREGQTLRGVISDIHGNDITLSMEDGSSFTGQLPDANQYSIGQKAAFLITGLENNTIYMKATTGAYLLNMEDTIAQALEEAMLPRSPRNLEVVRSLLNNQQSISRENIMASIQLCAQYPEADVHSVITMKCLGLPMTNESVLQFENYQNQTHQLLYKMDTLTDSIGDMLHAIGSQVPALAKETASALLDLALEGVTVPEQTGEAATVSAEENSEAPIPETGEEAADTTDNPVQNSSDGTAGAETSTPFSRVKNLINNLTESVGTKNTPEPETPAFSKEEVGAYLPEEERAAVHEQLRDLPFSEAAKKQLADGTLSVSRFLTEIKQMLPNLTDGQAGKLISSDAFRKLVKGQFLSNWTISPKQLKEPGALTETYEKMAKEWETLSHFSQTVLGKDVFSKLSSSASDMTENLNFMKTLNETFPYIQLPIKLQNQNAHADLYVMTRKEALKKNPDNLKVLLHLDMEHLGTLDIRIAKENTAVSLNFFVSEKDTLHLFERNVELLQDAINAQGYACTSELSLKEKEVDIVNDFLATNKAPIGDMKRYNFDLRA